MRCFRLLSVPGFLGMVVATLPSVSEASHFRGGFMSATISPNGVLTVSAETLWRKGGNQFSTFPLGGITRNAMIERVFPAGFQILAADRTVLRATSVLRGVGGGGPLPTPNIVATTVSVDFSDPFFDIRRQQFTIDLAALGLPHGLYILYWTDAARINGLHNVLECRFPRFRPLSRLSRLRRAFCSTARRAARRPLPAG